jgi:2,4-dienoyl-CoA reductase-like NADH-dependent reductase (Old Yellow Enzyme family)
MSSAKDSPLFSNVQLGDMTLRNRIVMASMTRRGTLIANGGFDKTSASRIIETRQADLVSFAKPFIGNPDLVRRFHDGLSLTSTTPDTYYQGGAQGYTDYPTAP